MDNVNSKRFKKNYPTHIDKINEMIECPKLYLVDYFDTAKAKLDADFVTKLSQIKDEDVELKEKTNKKWIQLIEIIDKCQAKCLTNKLSDEVINKAKEKLKQIESNKDDQYAEDKKSRVKDNLESYLLENDSFGVIFSETIDTQR